MSGLIELIESEHQILMRVYRTIRACLGYNNQVLEETSNLNLCKQIESSISALIKKQQHNQYLYQECLQSLQQKLRKHIKNQIQLKLYYQHLESVIEELKKQLANIRQKHKHQIQEMQTELSNYRDKIIVTAYETKKSQYPFVSEKEKKTVSNQIKKRLQLFNTDQYLRNGSSNISSKRQSIQTVFQKIYKDQESAKSQNKSRPKSGKSNKKSSVDKSHTSSKINVKMAIKKPKQQPDTQKKQNIRQNSNQKFYKKK